MDSYTKLAKVFPIKNKKTETVAKVLVEQVFTRLGCPLSILSDQGKEVDGRIIREVYQLFGINKNFVQHIISHSQIRLSASIKP